MIRFGRLLLSLAGCLAGTAFAISGPISFSFKPFDAAISEIFDHPPAELQKLVKQLAADDYADRQQAQQTILSAGRKYVPFLNRMRVKIQDLEARQRLDFILQTLAWNDISVGRTVRLTVQQVTPIEAIQLVVNQAGYRLKTFASLQQQSPKRLYDFDLPSMPFWQAIDKICNTTGYQVFPDEDGSLTVNNQDVYDAIASYSGPFRLTATQIYSGRYLQLSGLNRNSLPAANRESLSVNLMLSSEPKTPLIAVLGCRVTKVLDEKSRPLTIPVTTENVSQYYGHNTYRSYTQNLNLNFDRPSVESKSLKEIRGKASVLVLAESRPDITVDDLMKAKSQKWKGTTIDMTVNDVTEINKTSIQCTLAATTKTHNPQVLNHWMNSIGQKFESVDSKGNVMLVNVVNTNYLNETTVSLGLHITPPENVKPVGPIKLIFQEWTTRSMEIDFTFKDLPLP